MILSWVEFKNWWKKKKSGVGGSRALWRTGPSSELLVDRRARVWLFFLGEEMSGVMLLFLGSLSVVHSRAARPFFSSGRAPLSLGGISCIRNPPSEVSPSCPCFEANLRMKRCWLVPLSRDVDTKWSWHLHKTINKQRTFASRPLPHSHLALNNVQCIPIDSAATCG